MDREKILIEEYKQLQSLRGLWSSGMGGWNKIFVSLAAAIFAFFVTQYLSTDCSGNKVIFLWVGWGLFFVVMLYWRLMVHHIDQQIVAMYPRMLELESELGMEIQASYYYRNLNLKAKNHLAQIVGVSCEVLERRDYLRFKRYISANKSSSPHYYLLKVWDDFLDKKKAPWYLKIIAKHFINFSVTSRGHSSQDIIIACLVIIWPVINFYLIYR